ncbi:UNVERIFIED_CONTAM: protein CNGC15b [Sesamum angustifolium]|uniref:Protein CNGC15b n=1 Tax=Sesamum angustifolium TaxID=2727405 RepID=A0AAW2QPC4_9LAMI
MYHHPQSRSILKFDKASQGRSSHGQCGMWLLRDGSHLGLYGKGELISLMPRESGRGNAGFVHSSALDLSYRHKTDAVVEPGENLSKSGGISTWPDNSCRIVLVTSAARSFLWCAPLVRVHPSSSTRTVKAISEVEAFALRAEDLKFVAAQFRRLT